MNIKNYNYISFASIQEGISIARYLQKRGYEMFDGCFNPRTYMGESWHAYIYLKQNDNWVRFRGVFEEKAPILQGSILLRKEKLYRINKISK